MPSWVLLIITGVLIASMENNIQITNEVNNQEYITTKIQPPKIENSIEHLKEKIVEKEKKANSFIEEFVEAIKQGFINAIAAWNIIQKFKLSK